MGAACGSEACIFNILGISVKYSNMEMLERGYGISLRHLTNFAQKTYADGGCFAPKVISAMDREISGTDSIARLYKAVLMIQFKLEGQLIARHPESRRLQRQQMLLPRAHISTVHGFCAGLLREYFQD